VLILMNEVHLIYFDNRINRITGTCMHTCSLSLLSTEYGCRHWHSASYMYTI